LSNTTEVPKILPLADAQGVATTREDAVFTAQRVRIYSIALVAGALILPMLMFVRGVWLVNPEGAALPSDFLSFWSAGHLALEGRASAAYDFVALRAVEAQTVGVPFEGFFSFFYAPIFLLVMAPLAVLPYVWAFSVWGAGTLLLYLAVIRAIVPRPLALALALAWPPAILNFLDGQTGFLTVGLLGGALVFLESRPLAAGILLGLLTFKPQFGILVPIVLILRGHWRVLLSAVVTAALLAAFSVVFFGSETWESFIRSAPLANNLVLERGLTGWNKLQSVYAVARWLGVGSTTAWCAHGIIAVATCVVVCWTWLRSEHYELKAAALSAGTFIVTPYVLFYDLAGLAVPIAFLIRHGLARGFLRGERTLLACLPLITIPLPWLGVMPLGLVTALTLIGAVIAHQRESGLPMLRPRSLSPV
jgi:hypothetical protein